LEKKSIGFFCKIEKVKNMEYSTNNWSRSVETFGIDNNYEGILEEILDTKVLDSQYLAVMKQQNGPFLQLKQLFHQFITI
jgi:hypothetical protein